VSRIRGRYHGILDGHLRPAYAVSEAACNQCALRHACDRPGEPPRGGSLPAAMVRAERPGDGAVSAQHPRVPPVRRAEGRGAVAGRDDDPSVPPPAWEAGPGNRKVPLRAPVSRF